MKLNSSIFNKLDIFGTEYTFLIEGNRTFKTTIGAWMTLLYAFIVIGLFFGFGMDLYQRKNPKVSMNSQNFPYEPVQLSNQNFTYAYRIEDVDGIMQIDDSIFTMKEYFNRYDIINGSWVMTSTNVRNPQRCYDFPGYEEKEKIYNISLQSWYCVDFDNKTWGGNWDGNFVNFFRVNVDVCMNSTSNNTCATKEKIQNKFYSEISGGNMFFSDLSLYVQPALNDYEKPITTSIVNSYQMLNLDLTKRKVQTYKITAIDNDVGWFFEDLKHEFVISTNDILTDFTFKDRWTQSVLYNSLHYIGKNVETYRRSYTKIQEVFAAIGGFSKFFYTILVFLFSSVRKAYNNLILINSIPFNEDSLNDHKNKLRPYQVSKYVRSDMFNSNNISLKNLSEKRPQNVEMKSNFTYYDYLCKSVCKKKGEAVVAYRKLDRYNSYKTFFLKKLDILSYFDFHHKFSLMKKVLLSKDLRFMMKLIKPKLKTIPENVSNYTGIDGKTTFSKNSCNLIKQNSKVNLDEKFKILIGMMEEDVRKNFE